MAQQFESLEPKHRAFIERQRIFFTASATAASRINVSPRSTDAFRVLDTSSVCYLDLTGSGNETAAHLRADGRLTMMFCAVEGAPLILRLYGRGRTRQGKDVQVVHHTSAHGQRYQVDQSHKKFVAGLVQKGHDRIRQHQFRREVPCDGERDDWLRWR